MLKPIQYLFSKNNRLSDSRKKQLNSFCKSLGLRFSDIRLLDMAFHHRSFSNENHNIFYNNERLEFLGDAALGMAAAAYLYESMLDKPEGDLAKIKSVIVSETTLAQISLNIGLDKLLVLGNGEEHSGGRTKKAILADAMEAVIGACYLDSGYQAAEKLVLSLIVPEIQKVKQNKHLRDYKTTLQEYYQKKNKSCPVYTMLKRTGPDHDMTFWVEVKLDGKTYGPAQGKNKKSAEQEAAKIACQSLGLI